MADNGTSGSNGEWLDEYQTTLQRFETATGDIRTQNTLAAQVREEIESPIILDEALGYLGTKQEGAFLEMVAAQNHVPYDELLTRYGRVVNWLGAVSLRLDDMEQGQLDEQAAEKVYRDAKRLVELIPDLAEKLEDTVGRQIAALINERRTSAISEQQAAERVRSKLVDALGIVGLMPIPELLSAEQRIAIWESVQSPAMGAEELDAQPDVRAAVPSAVAEGESEPTNADIVARVRATYMERVQLPSELVALILAEEPGRVFTFDELALHIYGSTDNAAQQKIAMLIKGCERGTIRAMSDVFHERGLMLARSAEPQAEGAPRRRGRPIAPRAVHAVSASTKA